MATAQEVAQAQAPTGLMGLFGGPMGLLSMGSFGVGLLSQLFGDDPNEMNKRIAEQNRMMIEARKNEMLGVFDQRGEFFDERMAELSPFLAFSDTQGRQAATAGAKAAQSSVRRSLGTGGDLFSSILAAGAGTAAADRQNTLRALAIREAGRAADQEVNARVGVMGSMPFQFNPAWDPTRQNQMQQLWGQLGTAFGGLQSAQDWRNQMDQWMQQNENQNQGGDVASPRVFQ